MYEVLTIRFKDGKFTKEKAYENTLNQLLDRLLNVDNSKNVFRISIHNKLSNNYLDLYQEDVEVPGAMVSKLVKTFCQEGGLV